MTSLRIAAATAVGLLACFAGAGELFAAPGACERLGVSAGTLTSVVLAELDDPGLEPDSAPAETTAVESAPTDPKGKTLEERLDRAVRWRKIGSGMTWGGLGGALVGGGFALMATVIEIPELVWSGVGVAILGGAFFLAGIPLWVTMAQKAQKLRWKKEGIVAVPLLAPLPGGGWAGVSVSF